MEKPPVTLFYPSYVVEYAVVDSTVTFMDKKTLNVGGEWLGEVPYLAICKNIKTSEFHLSHCSSEWEDLCSVETEDTLEKIKKVAEKHYKGISSKWIPTAYKESDANVIFEKEKEDMKCSFCGKSHYDGAFTSLIKGENASICNVCVKSFSKEFEDEDS
jgi:hypothetical protein